MHSHRVDAIGRLNEECINMGIISTPRFWKEESGDEPYRRLSRRKKRPEKENYINEWAKVDHAR